jgi:hypothetical protein
MRIITRDRPGASRSLFAAVAIPVPIAGSVFELSRLKIVDRFENHVVVGRERNLCKRFAGERDNANSIGLPGEHELLEFCLCYLEPIVRLKILGEHGARQVDREHDVDTRCRDVLNTRAGPRTRQREDQRDKSDISQNENRSRDELSRSRSLRQNSCAREHNRTWRALATPQPPRREQKQQPERHRRLETEESKNVHAARFSAVSVAVGFSTFSFSSAMK